MPLAFRHDCRIVSIIALLGLAALAPAADAPQRLRRADSFLGIHFDFHANTDCKEVGKHTTPAMVENIIDLVHPDYLQIDCKGHPGFSSYPTKVGQPAPGIVGDPLRVWRDVTARRGVGLFMHYSGVFEMQAVRKPGWAAINADGKPNARATSFFGPYARELLVPQLRELATDYGVDGAWVDGECWASVPDYGPAAVEAFKKATGIQSVPRKPTDPHWFEFLEFHRQQFRDYLCRYIAAVKQSNPGFQICSNWAFTDHMAEPVSAPVDFLSGDYSPENSVNSARLSARYLVHQGKPWDLMAWSFAGKPQRVQKTAVQLQREAAVVLAQGGGFEAYFKQNRDGAIFPEQMPMMAEVARFCRARQAVCHHAMPVPQIGLLLSTADQYRRINALFSRDLGHIHGILQALLEGQQVVDLLGEHQFAGRMGDYPLLIVPECRYLAPEFRDQLVAYARNGGSLLVIGPTAAALFEKELAGGAPAQTSRDAAAKIAGGASPAAQAKASIATLGRGRIAAVYFNLGQRYTRDRPEALRRFLNDLVRELFPRPMVEVRGSADVDVCVARNHDRLLVNLVNTAGPHQTQAILDSIPAVGPLDVTIRLAATPVNVTLEPGARPLATEFRDGQLRLTVPKVEVHDIVVVETR